MKEQLLERLVNLSKETYDFDWENAHRLSKREIEFLLALMSKAYIHERTLLNVCGSPEKALAATEETVKREGLKVEEHVTY